MTKEEAEERFQARLAQAIRDEETARLQAIEDKKKFDEERLNRYLPTEKKGVIVMLHDVRKLV